MYSTCIHCQQDLGRNDLIEHLPIGRRIAFDATTGRLWVICGACARWNLVPFESRWEAIETGERLYRDATQRMSTGEIGLAKTREGTDLVRIGNALRPEMAAWRYGANFLRRRWKHATTTLPASLALGYGSLALYSLNGQLHLAAPPMIVLAWLAGYANHRLIEGRTQSRIAVQGEMANVTRYMVRQVAVSPRSDGSMELWLPITTSRVEDVPFMRGFWQMLSMPFTARSKRGDQRLHNAVLPSHFTRVDASDHARVLRQVLPLLHESGARSGAVTEAVAHLESSRNDKRALLFAGRSEWNVHAVELQQIHRPRRLALEMLVHEDSERRWLAGELLELEAEWRRANDIASIADALLRDPTIEAKLNTLRDGRTVTDGPSG